MKANQLVYPTAKETMCMSLTQIQNGALTGWTVVGKGGKPLEAKRIQEIRDSGQAEEVWVTMEIEIKKITIIRYLAV